MYVTIFLKKASKGRWHHVVIEFIHKENDIKSVDFRESKYSKCNTMGKSATATRGVSNYTDRNFLEFVDRPKGCSWGISPDNIYIYQIRVNKRIV